MATSPKGHSPGDVVLDRRVNIVSLANLGALIALLFTAISSWYGMVGRVDSMNQRIDSFTKELGETRMLATNQRSATENDTRELRAKSENIAVRLSVVETQINGVQATVNRIDQKLETGVIKPK